jgi:hypothetical protein
MFSHQEIADACRQFGPQLAPLPEGVDGSRLLWALSGNESSFGANSKPRHEPAFDAGGLYGDGAAMRTLLAKFGRAAACSYGPWQMMFCNAPSDFTPASFGDLHQAAQAAVDQLNRFLRKYKPQSLAEIGECWNAGHPIEHLSAGVARYVQQLSGNYAATPPWLEKGKVG